MHQVKPDYCSRSRLFLTNKPNKHIVIGFEKMNDLANRGNDALFNIHGKFYEAGCIPCVLYVASGTSLDWALGVAGIPYVYSIELRDTGAYGFLLPPAEIIPNAEETWAFHLVAARQIIDEFGS